MSKTRLRSVSVSALALCLVVGSAGIAVAQTQGRGSSRSDPSGSAGTDPGRILLLGTEENCPPTVACTPPRRERPRPAKQMNCDRWTIVTTPSGKKVEKCLMR